jgi:hypothetical protein
MKMGLMCTMNAQKLPTQRHASAHRSAARAAPSQRASLGAHYCMRNGLPLYLCTTFSWSRPTMMSRRYPLARPIAPFA